MTDIKHVFTGRVIELNVERVRLPNGSIAELEIVKHPGGAAIVAIDEQFGTYECHMNAAVTDRKGKIFYVNATNKAVLADASAAGTLSRIMGLAGTREKMSIAGESVSLIRKAILYVGTILDARRCLLLAFGPAKVRAVEHMVEGPLSAMCPGSALQLHPRATIILDETSSAGLHYADHYRWIDSHKLDWQKHV
jgi:hypothetical protein